MISVARLIIIVTQLRNEESQAALAELAASPVIHFAASIDHVNAPLMWDVGLAEKFNWVRVCLCANLNLVMVEASSR